MNRTERFAMFILWKLSPNENIGFVVCYASFSSLWNYCLKNANDVLSF